MDDADRAKDLEMSQRQTALADQQRRAMITDKPLVIDGQIHCRDCQEPIPLARLAVQPNSARCVTCKQTQENRQ